MKIPHYDEDENAFYERAIARQEKPEPTVGRWPDNAQNGYHRDWVGPVRIRVQDSVLIKEPYTASEAREVTVQGRDRPRTLSQDDVRLANARRKDAREQAQWFEAWAHAAFGVKKKSAYSNVSTEYIPKAPDNQGRTT